jgi:hypothetical protein
MSTQIDTDAKVQGENTNGFGQRQVISVGSRLYAAHITETNDIEVHYSDTNGASWNLDMTFSGITNPLEISLCKSELDDLFLMYRQGTASPIHFIIKKRDRTTGLWSEVRDESVSDSNTHGMIVYNGANNRLFLMWTISDGFVFKTRYSSDYGSSWSSGSGWSWGSGPTPGPLWGIDTDNVTGNMYAFADVPFFDPQTIILNGNGDRTGSEAVRPPNTYGGGLVIDSAGNRWQMSYFETGGSYFLRVNKNNDSTASLEVNYGVTDALKRGMFSIGADGLDNIYIFYVKESDGKCYYRKFDAASQIWGMETALTTGDGFRPSCEQHSLPSSDKLQIVFYTS